MPPRAPDASGARARPRPERSARIMSDRSKIRRLADLLLAARASAEPLATLPEDLVPLDAAEADAVQFACAEALGPIGAWKVLQIADRDGSFGFIPASHVSVAPTEIVAPGATLKIELEIAFRIGRDLPGRADGTPYSVDEVTAAIAGALPVFEIVETRLPPASPALAARADAMSNRGLVTGPEIADWRALVHDAVAVTLDISGRTVVARTGGHPTGDPAHALPWLADALARAGHPLVADQVVTTGAFGGSHAIVAGDVVTGAIAGFAPITVRVP